MRLIFVLSLLLAFTANEAGAVRVKDIARIQGARQNQLVGYGMVVGLAGTGDSNPNVTLQTVANFMNRFGVTVAIADIKANNAAIVVVTADLPPFVRNGSRIDVQVSSVVDAKSLLGGVLMQTPLVGADGQVYAVSQGPLVVGGYFGGVPGAGGATLQKNHVTVATISGGALIEREVPMELVSIQNTLDVSLREPDFTTAARMADAFNRRFTETAMAVDGGTVRISIPPDFIAPSRQVQFISQVENVELEPDTVTRVIINERTGTIVANAKIKVSSVAIAHGNFIVSIAQAQQVSQPLPFSTTGTTVTTTATTTGVVEPQAPLAPFPELPTVNEVAKALNLLGATPRDMMTIFQALKQAGALQAELIVQ